METHAADQGAKFWITDTKIYVPFVTLLTQDDAKLLGQLKYDFQKRISGNKYQSKKFIVRQNQNLIDTGFHEKNNIFILLFENETNETNELQTILSSNRRNKKL